MSVSRLAKVHPQAEHLTGSFSPVSDLKARILPTTTRPLTLGVNWLELGAVFCMTIEAAVLCCLSRTLPSDDPRQAVIGTTQALRI